MDIFKVQVLGEKPTTIVFGSDPDMKDQNQTQEEKGNDANIIYSEYSIHLDDTVQTIKNKILITMKHAFSYEEIYLYSELSLIHI